MRSNWLCEWKIVKSLITKIRIGMHTGLCVIIIIIIITNNIIIIIIIIT